MTNIREKKSVLLYSEKSQPYGYRNVIYVLNKKARKEDYLASLVTRYLLPELMLEGHGYPNRLAFH